MFPIQRNKGDSPATEGSALAVRGTGFVTALPGVVTAGWAGSMDGRREELEVF